MHFSGPKISPRIRLVSTILAAATLSACATTTPTLPRPTAGTASSHTPQTYQPLSSTAATTSTLAGSMLRWPSGATIPVSWAVTGTRTGDTGGTTINDGTYLFAYQHGDGTGTNPNQISDGNGAGGTYGEPRFAGTYDYVRTYTIHYGPTTDRVGLTGFVGVVTALSDTPIAGSASYTGEVLADKYAHGTTPDTVHFNRGTSNVSVDFTAGTVNVDLGNFQAYTDGNDSPITAAAAPFDQITGTGMTISGTQFTGGSWVTLKGGVVQDVVGANRTVNSNGTFFGYDPSISAPDEVAGVFVINGDTAIITGRYIAD